MTCVIFYLQSVFTASAENGSPICLAQMFITTPPPILLHNFQRPEPSKSSINTGALVSIYPCGDSHLLFICSFIHSFIQPFLYRPFKSSTTQRRSRRQHGYCIRVSHRSAQATAGKGLAL